MASAWLASTRAVITSDFENSIEYRSNEHQLHVAEDGPQAQVSIFRNASLAYSQQTGN